MVLDELWGLNLQIPFQLQIWRADCKVLSGFPTEWMVGSPNPPHVVQKSIVGI